jgi:hypothetical protein
MVNYFIPKRYFIKMKEVFDKYIISLNSSNMKDIENLLNILKRYNVRAQNYKVEYSDGKVNIRVVKGNAILDLSNLSLKDLEEILMSSQEIYTNRFNLIFHNIPSTVDVLEKLEKTNLPFSQVDVFKDYIRIKTERISFVDSKDLEATYYLSLVLDKIEFRFNLGRIKRTKDMLALALLKYYGIRDLNLIDKIMEHEYIVDDDRVVIKDLNIIVCKNGIFNGNKKISKKDLYEIIRNI